MAANEAEKVPTKIPKRYRLDFALNNKSSNRCSIWVAIYIAITNGTISTIGSRQHSYHETLHFPLTCPSWKQFNVRLIGRKWRPNKRERVVAANVDHDGWLDEMPDAIDSLPLSTFLCLLSFFFFFFFCFYFSFSVVLYTHSFLFFFFRSLL